MNLLKTGIAVAAAITFAAAPASAATIAQYLQFNSSAKTMQFANNGGGTYSLSALPWNASRTVGVSLTDPETGMVGFGSAKLIFSAVGAGPIDVMGNVWSLPFSSGSLQLVALAPISLGMKSVTNILTFNFTNGELSGQSGTRSPVFTASLPSSTFTNVSSDYLPASINLANFSISMSDASAALIPTNGGIANFTAASTGTFAVVPEPGTWAMLVTGFGLIGWARRRRNIVRPVTA